MYWVRVPMTGGLIWVISLFKELVSFQQSPIAEGDEEEKTNGNPVSSGHIYNIYIFILVLRINHLKSVFCYITDVFNFTSNCM